MSPEVHLAWHPRQGEDNDRLRGPFTNTIHYDPSVIVNPKKYHKPLALMKPPPTAETPPPGSAVRTPPGFTEDFLPCREKTPPSPAAPSPGAGSLPPTNAAREPSSASPYSVGGDRRR